MPDRPDSRLLYFDGAKSVRMEQLPEDAWRVITGGAESGENTPAGVYQVVPWVYRAIEMRGQTLADIPWNITKGKNEVVNSADWQPVRGLEWTRSLRSLLLRTEQARCLYGAAYWLRVPNLARTRSLEFRWLLPPSITPKFDSDKPPAEQVGLVGFERTVGATKALLSLADVVYLWLPSITAELGPGTAPARVAMRAAGLARNVDAFAEAFFARGAINATILQVPAGTSPEEIRKLEAWWKRLMRGVKGAFETVGLRATVVPIQLSGPPKDLAMVELAADKRKDIAVAFGVPYSLLNSESANFATAEQEDLSFYTKTLLPESELIEEDLNRQVFEPAGFRFSFQPARLELFQQRESKKAFALIAAVNSGVMTANEWREEMDMEPHDGGDDLRAPQANPKFGSNAESAGQVAADAGASPGVASGARSLDLRRWERKALRAVKDGRTADVPFETDVVDWTDQVALRSVLAVAGTVDEVRAAFAALPAPIAPLALPAPASNGHGQLADFALAVRDLRDSVARAVEADRTARGQDQTTALVTAMVQMAERTGTPAPLPSITVFPPQPSAEPRVTRRVVERDADGRIVAVVKSWGLTSTRQAVLRDSEGRIVEVIEAQQSQEAEVDVEKREVQ